MANWKPENAVLTDAGLTMLSKAQVGLGKMVVTRVGVRSTYDSIENSRKLNLDTALNGIKIWGDIYKPKEGINPDGGVLDPDKGDTSNADSSLIKVRFSNEYVTNETGDVQVRQVIVFMKLIDIAEGVEDVGEVPYMVAQSEATSEKDDYDLLPTFDSNPTIINYDLYIIHSGVASIQVNINKDGYVTKDEHDTDITEIWNVINNIQTNEVGQHTGELTFKLWKPVYDPDSRDWSREDSLLPDWKGNKTAERFNLYETPDTSADPYADNIAVGITSHVEGENNLSTASSSHVEGVDNYAGFSSDDSVGDASHNANRGTHVEGECNSAMDGWTQHIEGSCNVGTGYCSHIEGKKNVSSGSLCHIEGTNNTVTQGGTHHVGGNSNTVEGGNTHHVEGYKNSISGSGDCTHLGGQLNIVSGSGEAFVHGRENVVRNSNQAEATGLKNKIIDSVRAKVSGTENTIVNSQGSNVSGTSNTLTNSRGSTVSGQQNSVSNNCFETSVSGYINTASDSVHTIISGISNIVDKFNNSMCIGKTNRASLGVESTIILGENNIVRNNLNSVSYSDIVGGNGNTVTDTSELIITGFNNSITSSSRSVISGRDNTAIIDTGANNQFGVSDCFISGQYNQANRLDRSVLVGLQNTVTDYKPNGVSGERMSNVNNIISGESNSFSGIFSSIVTGKENNITNIHDSIIGGKNNTIISEVGDISTNCVLCVGFNNTVDNNGTPMTAFGSNNTISSNNSAVFGYYNIASGNDQVVLGHYNIGDTENKYALIVGGGSNDENRKNILTLDWEGNLHVKNLYASGLKNEDGTDIEIGGGLELDGIANGTGTNSLIFGNISANVANAENAVAMGNATEASGTNAVSMGADTRASGNQSCAIGQASEALADYAFAAGNLSKAHGQATAVFNTNNTANSDSAGTFVCGANNIAGTDINSLVSGENNAVSNTIACFTSGKSNSVSYSQYSGVFGTTNTVDDSDNCIVSGTNCSSHNSDNNIVNGTHANVYSLSSNNIVSGNNVHANSTKNSLVVGTEGTTVQDTDSCIVSGESTSVKQAEGSLIVGTSNQVGSDHGMGGAIDTPVDNTGVIFTGNTVVGNDNYIRSAKSQVFGRNNLVAGASNFLAGYSNSCGYYFGSPSDPQDTIKNQTNNILIGSNNDSLGINNTLIGKGLSDHTNYSGFFPNYSQDNPVSFASDGSTFLGKYNLNNAAILNDRFFVVGCGTSESNSDRANALSISNSGRIYTNNTINTTGADVAEWFEWEDANTNNEDRRGLFVTLVGDKITLADENTSYIHGIVSARPALVGNAYEDTWNKKYLTDVFGEILYEDKLIPAVTEKTTNEDGEEVEVIVEPEHTIKAPIINPDYDPNEEYIPRSQRPEWSYVSCCGRLVVVDDGTCQPNSYCRPKSGGIATASETGFRVMKRIDDTHILVWTNGAVTFE